MARTKKYKRKIKNNKDKISALKNKIQDNTLENREISTAINKIVNPPANKPLTSLLKEPPIEKYSSDALEMLSAKDIMQRDLCWCNLETSIEQAMEEFNRYKCSYIAVGENNNLQGLLSRKDLLAAQSPYLKPEFAKWRRPIDYASLKIKIKWLIKDKCYEVVTTNDRLENVMQKMLWTKSRCVAVIDKFEKIVGIITTEDIFDNILAYKQKIHDQNNSVKIKEAASNKRISQAIAELAK